MPEIVGEIDEDFVGDCVGGRVGDIVGHADLVGEYVGATDLVGDSVGIAVLDFLHRIQSRLSKV